LVPFDRQCEYMTLMGEWSIARGAPKSGEILIPPIVQRLRLRDFFADVARPALDLVAAYRARQAARG